MRIDAEFLKRACRQWRFVPIALGLAALAQAHHSFSNFDQSKRMSLSGTVKAFEFHFPHAWIWVDIPGSKGSVQTWGFEGAGPVELNRIGGWTAGTLRPGDKITVTFCPQRDGKAGGAFTSVQLADGRVLKGFELACVPKKPPQ